MPKTKAGKPAARPTASEMRRRLSEWADKRKGDWVTMTEVRDATGFTHQRNRYADAVAIQCWPSAGLELHGFEIKVSRSDLISELTDPEKAQAIKQYCDRWWLVIPSSTLLRDGELPTDWGLLISHGKHLKVSKAAPPLKPEPMPRAFLASLLRSAKGGNVADKALREAVDAAERRGCERGRKLSERDLTHARTNYDCIKSRLDEFERVVGRIDMCTIPDLKERIEAARALDASALLRRITNFRNELDQMIERFNRWKGKADDENA